MRMHPAEASTRHCANIHCRKCQARDRWYRRKAWRCHRPLSETFPGKK